MNINAAHEEKREILFKGEEKFLKSFNPEIVNNNQDSEVGYDNKFKILDVLGKGGSCVVYEVEYENECSSLRKGVLKQFNPVNLDQEIDALNFGNTDNFETIKEQIEICKERFIKSYIFQCMFKAQCIDAINITSNPEKMFIDKNGTYYILTTPDNGMSYDKIKDDSILDILKTALAITKAVKVYHENGYLHLDIKPSNVLILKETREMVKLFDFDSIHEKKSIGEYDGENLILPYSEGYSPSELKDESKYFMVSEKTDIYSIGALVCSKIFGKVKNGAYYSIDKNDERFKNISPKIERLLNEFFRKTLTQITSRYKTTDEVIKVLEEMIKIAAPNKIFLATERWSADSNAYGRNEELKEIHDRLEKDNVVFIYGMGGLGKSETAKMYAERYRNEYDHIQFISYSYENNEGSIKDVITDLAFVNFRDSDCDSRTALYKEKVFQLKRLTQRDLIVIDNFNTSFDDDLRKIISNDKSGPRIIFTTRNTNQDYISNYLELKPLDNEKCVDLFYKFYTREIKNRESEERFVREIINIDNNTLVIKLTALICENAEKTPEEMLELLKNSALSDIEDNIRLTTDIYQSNNNQKVFNHLRAIFNVADLSEEEKEVLTNMSLFGITRIDKKKFKEWCCFKNYNSINLLIENGWIQEDKKNSLIFLHHIISEIAYIELEPDDIKCENLITILLQFDKIIKSNREFSIFKIYDDILKRLNGKTIVAAQLYKKIGFHLKDIRYLFEALNIYKKVYGKYHKDVAELYFEIMCRSRYEKIEYYFNQDIKSFFIEIIDVYEKVYGKYHEKTARIYSRLLVYGSGISYSDKLLFADDAIAIHKKLHGSYSTEINEMYLRIISMYSNLYTIDLNRETFEKMLSYSEDYINNILSYLILDSYQSMSKLDNKYTLHIPRIEIAKYYQVPRMYYCLAERLNYKFIYEISEKYYIKVQTYLNFYGEDYYDNFRIIFATYKEFNVEIENLKLIYYKNINNDCYSAIEKNILDYEKENLNASFEKVRFYKYIFHMYKDMFRLTPDEYIFNSMAICLEKCINVIKILFSESEFSLFIDNIHKKLEKSYGNVDNKNIDSQNQYIELAVKSLYLLTKISKPKSYNQEEYSNKTRNKNDELKEINKRRKHLELEIEKTLYYKEINRYKGRRTPCRRLYQLFASKIPNDYYKVSKLILIYDIINVHDINNEEQQRLINELREIQLLIIKTLKYAFTSNELDLNLDSKDYVIMIPKFLVKEINKDDAEELADEFFNQRKNNKDKDKYINDTKLLQNIYSAIGNEEKAKKCKDILDKELGLSIVDME